MIRETTDSSCPLRRHDIDRRRLRVERARARGAPTTTHRSGSQRARSRDASRDVWRDVRRDECLSRRLDDMSAWTSPLDLVDDGVDFARSRVNARAEREAANSGAYEASRRARAYGWGDFDGVVDEGEASSEVVVIASVGSEAGRALARACVDAAAASRRGVVVAGGVDVSNAGFGAVDDASWTTVYEGFVDGRGRTAVATTEADASPAGARAWAREILRASGVVSGDGTVSKTSDVLIVTSCSEHETSEAEMSLGAIDAVTAYGLDTTALRVESPPTWPSPPRSLPVGVLLRSNGASALLNACEMFGIRARVVAIPESEPVRAMYGGADVQAAREAAAQASALLGVELACDFKARLAPTRAENVYA